MENVMRYLITTALLTTALALPLGSANAQSFSGDVIAQCTRAVGQMKFEGWPADRNRDMMMLSCEQNGGVVPGAQQERPAALRNAPRR
jgi:hypothetical protein